MNQCKLTILYISDALTLEICQNKKECKHISVDLTSTCASKLRESREHVFVIEEKVYIAHFVIFPIPLLLDGRLVFFWNEYLTEITKLNSFYERIYIIIIINLI